jgi:hypothetical protein
MYEANEICNVRAAQGTQYISLEFIEQLHYFNKLTLRKYLPKKALYQTRSK